ncbi:MAG: diguanylate phosphodiesterase [Cycloclasticus sp. symbiont of Bathymodiolus heckerae]|nr:MAG: diguanylate phosphodiesterase [Cycloclasticus sp. symbiont of Bathymodiolus heckerae]
MKSKQNEKNQFTTGLADEATFIEQTHDLLEFSKRTEAEAAMLYITFDSHVNEINQQQNDLATQAIAKRLLAKARDSDIYAYLGSMTFANLSIKTGDRHTATLVEKLKNELAQAIELTDGTSIKLNAKIGTAEFPSQGNFYEELISIAKKDCQ